MSSLSLSLSFSRVHGNEGRRAGVQVIAFVFCFRGTGTQPLLQPLFALPLTLVTGTATHASLRLRIRLSLISH